MPADRPDLVPKPLSVSCARYEVVYVAVQTCGLDDVWFCEAKNEAHTTHAEKLGTIWLVGGTILGLDIYTSASQSKLENE
jgi:hypothetical protein